ncbi:hypothetical protein EV138_5413 [Kribbella voronezhensis]|uniref:Ribosomally synthesized peptide with SipW-like signal peptide n=1 Tax=Kribbella voronezhensis TaxID=2512212 RepID=A0A4R7THM8_9ACTN|nr:hypothetical protein [Kribbella voronezhensis]TDU91800.1 hypothetical protein EV138_5413 [Kribbella voronezhensis]
MRNKKKIILAGVAVAVIGAGSAFAYWTNIGSGNGTGTTGTNAAISVSQTSVVTELAPGAPAQALSGTFTNTNNTPVYVEKVSVSIDPGFSKRADSTKPACTAADFTLVQPTATNAEVITGATWSGGSIAMINSPANQDNCKGVTVPLVYSSN